MNLKKHTNAVNAEKKLILHPAHMKLDKSSCNFLPGTISRQEIDPSGLAKGLSKSAIDLTVVIGYEWD